MSYHGPKYEGFIYERIGTISMLVSGRLKDTIDLAEMLARLRFSRPAGTMGHLQSEIRLSEFWKWKKATLLRREVLGFPVVWPHDMVREWLILIQVEEGYLVFADIEDTLMMAQM